MRVDNLEAFFSDYLEETGLLEAVFCRAGYASNDMPALNARFTALRPARESRAASLKLGRRFLQLAASLLKETFALDQCHLCIAFGLAGGTLGLGPELVCAAYLHQSTFGQISACQRLLPLGQTRCAADTSATSPPIAATSGANAPSPAAADKPASGNGVAEVAKADASVSAASTTAPAIVASHERSPVAAHAPTDSSDTGVQAQGAVQPQLSAVTAAAAPAQALSVTMATNAPVPLNGLALEIAVSARSGKSRFEIRLDPAELGRIDVRIDVDRNGQVTSHLTVERPETLALLRQDAPQLQRQLDDAGFKTGDGGLQFSLRDQSSSGQNNGNETSRNAQRLIVRDDEVIPATVAGRSYGRMLGSSSGVDIRV